ADAFQRARSWIREWRNAYLSAKLILRMAQASRAEQASNLARLSVDAIPNATFEMAGVLSSKGHAAISRQMLTYWADREQKPSDDQVRSYVYASMRAGDVRGPFLKLTQLARTGTEPIVQARLADELAKAYGFAALAPLRPLLSMPVLLSKPLFAAELAIFEGN